MLVKRKYNDDKMERELEILDHLVDAWNKFLDLDIQHPNERDYFADGINICQHVIAMRYARKNNPEIFPKIENK